MHPNVVMCTMWEKTRAQIIWSWNLWEGITLKQYIQKKGRLSAKEAISITIQMANGIQAAHNKNIIHRDIKPQNVIISKRRKGKSDGLWDCKGGANSNTMKLYGAGQYIIHRRNRREEPK